MDIKKINEEIITLIKSQTHIINPTQIWVIFDNGSYLALISGIDRLEVI